MKTHQKALLDLLGRALFGAHVQLPENLDFKALYKESNEQTVTVLVFDALTQDELKLIDKTTLDSFKTRVAYHTVVSSQLSYEQGEVLKIMRENAIPCAILKGSSVAQNYPNPDLRVMGDIDLLVPSQFQEKTAELIKNEGTKISKTTNQYHISVKRGNIEIEVHDKPNGLGLPMEESTKKKLGEIFKNALEKVQIKGESPTLSTQHQALSLLLHKLSHFLNEGIGLRQLCDWACFVKEVLNEEEFEKLKPTLEEFGLLQFAGAVTRVCCDFLHLPKECAKWALEFDKDLSAEIIEQILTHGNFGCKENTYGQRLFTDSTSKNRLMSAVKVLTRTCKERWSPCRKYPVLLIIAPFVLFFKYLDMRRKNLRPKLELAKIYKKSKPKQELYKSLKPFITKKQ